MTHLKQRHHNQNTTSRKPKGQFLSPKLAKRLSKIKFLTGHTCKKGKRKVQRVPQSQAAAFSDTKRKRKQTKPNKRKSNKHKKSTNISSLSKRGNSDAKMTEKRQEQNNTRQDCLKCPRGRMAVIREEKKKKT